VYEQWQGNEVSYITRLFNLTGTMGLPTKLSSCCGKLPPFASNKQQNPSWR
jgi:hypothetical protein